MCKQLTGLLLLLLPLFSCKKTEDSNKQLPPEVNALVRNLTGFDGCGLVLELTTGERLEPISIPEGTTLMPGKLVAIRYVEAPAASICMIGATVKILRLRYL